MAGMVGAVAVVAEVDPTVQPVRASFYVFLFMAVMLAVLLFSFVRHMRRAQANLGSAKEPVGLPEVPPARPAGSGDDAR
jgi:hypothetical protein